MRQLQYIFIVLLALFSSCSAKETFTNNWKKTTISDTGVNCKWEMVDGAYYAGINDWNKAMEYWQFAHINGTRLFQYKAAYNMSIACEVQGQYKLALSWAEKAQTLHSSVTTKSGIQVRKLQHRINNGFYNYKQVAISQ